MEIEKKITGWFSIAIPFEGSKEEAEANFATHSFDPSESRCWNCDCRPWGVWANLPCGNADQTIERRLEGSDGSQWREIVEIRGGVESLIFSERIDQPEE